ncbi:MAG: SUMF1/EgtB/PvdO family nonheme iron enzyme [Acidobacteriota bacterium]
MALVGDLKDLPLADIIQINCIGHNMARLLVHYPVGDAIFYFQDGEVFDARLGELSGVNAIYEALKYNEGAFRIDAGVSAPNRTIFKPWAELLMDGLRRLDEAKAGIISQTDESEFIRTGQSFLERSRPGTAPLAAKKELDVVGTVINEKYRIDSKIKEGELGTMYRATHMQMDVPVAIKVLHSHLVNDQPAVERFRRGAHAAARIHHPNAISVIDFGSSRDNIVYIAMEYLDGQTLRDRISERQYIPAEELAKILRQICAGLEAAHRQGIIHRDIKPENIMLYDSSGEELVKVLDFGIAKLKALSEAGVLTAHGLVMGTHSYMSPELCEGAEIDNRSDVYSLGVVLYEALTGQLPFIAPTPVSVALKHIGERPQSLRIIRPEISESIDHVVLRALEKRPEDRQQSALELAKEFEEALTVKSKLPGIAASATSPSFVPPKPARFEQFQPSDQFATRGIPEISAGELGEPRTRLPKPFDVLYDPALSSGRNGGATNSISPLPEPYTEPLHDLNTQPLLANQVDTLQSVIVEEQPSILYRLLRSNKFLFVFSTFTALVIFLGALILWQYFKRQALIYPPPAPPTVEIKPVATSPIGEMILIPAGKFQMGRSIKEGASPDETPVHEVKVANFYLGRYEVTNKEYREFVIAQSAKPPVGWNGVNYPPGTDNFPVTNISWQDVQAYCDWLSKTKGEHYRLPTEEEWEYAARGSDGRIYPWGANFDAKLTVSGEFGGGKSIPVDSQLLAGDKGPFGNIGLAGNVTEWTSSTYRLYPGSKAKLDKNCLNCRIYRGGNYRSSQRGLTNSYRGWNHENYIEERLGFRIAKDAK